MSVRIFLVEDNPIIRDNLVPTLEDLVGAEVLATVDSESRANAWLDTHRTDWQLAVVDMFLAQGSGLGVLKHCRERLPRQRVVVLSNYATADLRARSLALGADAVFDKSNELDDFIDYCLNVH
jgi:DNA-binding NarL/FixJ family response regulator